MRATKQSIIAEALSLVDDVSSDLQNTISEGIKENNYQTALTKILGRRAWSAFFTRKLLTNYSLVEDGEHYKFNKKFPLPTDFNRMFAVAFNIYDIGAVELAKIWESGEDYYLDRYHNGDYELIGNNIYSNSERLFLAYMHGDLDKAGALNPAFVTALTTMLAGYFAFSLRGSMQLKRDFLKEAENEIIYASNAEDPTYRQTQRNPIGLGGVNG